MNDTKKNGGKDAGQEYAEIWGEAIHSNRHLRVLSVGLGIGLLLLIVVVIRIVSVEPPRPIVVRVDEIGRAEAVAYEAMEAQADPLDPTTKYFLNRFIHDFYSRRRATVQEHWSRSLRFLSTELANASSGPRAGTSRSWRREPPETSCKSSAWCCAFKPIRRNPMARRPTSIWCGWSGKRRLPESAGRFPCSSGSSRRFPRT